MRGFWGLALIFLFALCSSQAQVNTGSIRGTVRDNSQAALPGARVIVQSVETGSTHAVTSDSVGNYEVPDLTAGHYTITVSRDGFKTTTLPDVELQVAERASINPVLEVGAVTEKVVVTSEAIPLMNTDTSSLGQVIDTKAVSSMPLNGRSFWQLTQLTPGVSYIDGGQNPSTGGTAIRASVVNVNVNGLSPTWTGWYLDGADVTEFQAGGTIIQPNVDALQEFKVEGGNMSAEYGHTPTVINSSLKSGSNAFHGGFYEFFRNNILDAANYFFVPAPGTHQRDEPLHRNQFGLYVGGPIVHNKAFFFVDGESTLFRLAEDFNNTVPSDLERGGNFNGAPTIPTDPTNVIGGKPQPFPNNTIPAGRISSVATYFLKYMPHANNQVGSLYRAINTNALKQQLDKADIKIDYELTSKDHVMARYSIADNHETDPNAYPTMGSFPLWSRGQDPEVRWAHTFNSNWINEAQASYYRSYFFFTTSFQGQNINNAAGIQGMDGLAPIQYLGFPGITISGYSNYTGASTNSYPKSNRLRSWQYVDRVTHVAGKHDMRFGAEWFHNNLQYVSGSNSVGNFSFNGAYTGDNFADFLLGYAKGATRSYFRQIWGSIADFQAFYFQDDYRLRPDLTLNLGVRWEINPFYDGLHGQTTGFDPADPAGHLIIPSNFSLQAQPATPTLYPLFQDRIQLTNSVGLPDSIRPSDKHNVVPRVGFAWNPNGGKWVVRAGYGIFFGYPDDNNINNTQNSVPFIASQTVTNSGSTTSAPPLNWNNMFGNTPIVAANPNPGQACSFGFAANSCSTPNLVSMPPHVHNTYTQEWNLAVQHQVGKALSYEVAYVGNKTNRNELQWAWNDPPAGSAASVQSRRPWQQWGTITLGEFAGAADYNSLQAKLDTHVWHGATALIAYTYSKCLDNGTYNVGSDVHEVHSNISYWGVCQYNLTNNIVVSYNYQLPIGRGQPLLNNISGWENQILGNWTFSGITTMQSGLPFTVTLNSDTANTGYANQRPNYVGKPVYVKSPLCWFYTSFNKACGTLAPGTPDTFQVPAAYTYGNLGRNTMRADDLVQFDFSVLKPFPISKERSLEFRAEFFNVFNRPTFAGPSTIFNASSGSVIGSTLNGSRQIEFALKGYF